MKRRSLTVITLMLVVVLFTSCDSSPFSSINDSDGKTDFEFTVEKSEYTSGDVIEFQLTNIGGSTVYLPKPNPYLSIEQSVGINMWENKGSWYAVTMEVPELVSLKPGESLSFDVDVDALLELYDVGNTYRFQQLIYPEKERGEDNQQAVHSTEFTIYKN
ncbi:MAG: hypothetical protein ACQETE_03370 [Bacteroidota bacterium]